MRQRHFENIETNGVTLRTMVEGEGPLVVLLHGWPQCWHLWRNQIDPIIDAGYRVAVPNQRGYAGSSAPNEVSAYNIRELAADAAGIAPALGYDEFIAIGHDWGCIVAWNTALLHKDTCKAVMGLSVPGWRATKEIVNPPGKDDRFWYIRMFQTPGLAEPELESDIERSLLGIYYALSGDSPPLSFVKQLEYPADSKFHEIFPVPEKLPPWLTQEDIDYYVEHFRSSGFRGPNNWYANVPTNNEITPELKGKKMTQPAAFAVGALDDDLTIMDNWRERFERAFEDLRFLEVLEGVGHWVPMEKPAEITALILRFLKGL